MATAHHALVPRIWSAGRRARSIKAATFSTPSTLAAMVTSRRVAGLSSAHRVLATRRLCSGTGRVATSESREWTGLPSGATIVAMSTESLRTVRDHLSEMVDRVEYHHERLVVTRNGRPAAVLISPDDLAQLEETINVLGDSDALADIREADAAYARGEVARGIDAVRGLRG